MELANYREAPFHVEGIELSDRMRDDELHVASSPIKQFT
jgi:hypothetical protein